MGPTTSTPSGADLRFPIGTYDAGVRMLISETPDHGSDSRRLRTHPVLKALAARLGATPARLALAWLLRQPGVVVIPKASSEAHVRDNYAALELELTPTVLAELDRTFPPPKRATPLAMI